MKNTVLITGTSSGIGKATAKEFAKNGWNVIATMRNPANEKELTQVNNIFVARFDVEQPDTIQEAIAAGIRQFGGIDVLINNAGQGLFGVFEATPLERIQRLFEVNVSPHTISLSHFSSNSSLNCANSFLYMVFFLVPK